MSITINSGAATATGGVLATGGLIATGAGLSKLLTVARATDFQSARLGMPLAEQANDTLRGLTEFLSHMQGSMAKAGEIPAEGLLRNIPVIGGRVNDAERVLRINSMLHEFAGLNETKLVDNSIKLSEQAEKMVGALHSDLATLHSIRSGVSKGTVLAGAGIAALLVGAALVASAQIDIS